MKKILVLNGPNLNLLGKREINIYGEKSLTEIEDYTNTKLKSKQVELDWYQSNHEGELVQKIQEFHNGSHDALIINPAGYSHTSVAIYDAMKICTKPIIEVHLSNIFAREEFRQTLLTARAASKIMSGLGKDAYYLAAISEL